MTQLGTTAAFLRRFCFILAMAAGGWSCDDEDSTNEEPEDRGRSGDRSEDSRQSTEGMDASAADSGRADTGAGSLDFRVRFKGDSVVLVAPSDRGLLHQECTPNYHLEKRVANAWLALVDARPGGSGGNHRGYYLDGRFIYPDFSLGCDYISCVDLTEKVLGRAVEYVQTGTREPPADVDYADIACAPSDSMIPVVESRAVSGELRARFEYAVDSCNADNWREATVELEVPAEGVCCPLGDPDSGADFGAGGWAPSADACWSWRAASGTHVQRAVDARECPAFVVDTRYPSPSCEDAG